jgi:hypothetical protein
LPSVGEENDVAICEVCGNDYDKPIEVNVGGRSHVFDCFECAIHGLAPICEHCGVRIVGHGAEAAGHFYCSASCAAASGISTLRDRVEELAR